MSSGGSAFRSARIGRGADLVQRHGRIAGFVRLLSQLCVLRNTSLQRRGRSR